MHLRLGEIASDATSNQIGERVSSSWLVRLRIGSNKVSVEDVVEPERRLVQSPSLSSDVPGVIVIVRFLLSPSELINKAVASSLEDLGARTP
jgi:hypothetical protein